MGDSQYSFSLTTISPTGMLVPIGSGQTSLGIKATNGVVIATEKKLPSILVEESSWNGFEGHISGKNIETGKIGGDKQFRHALS
ncbi:hypothetical protein DKX38_018735 [Salix brachista]|uniref:Proteasome alpha-type subunits domain-containing protein n=1 Tax=Salix brachista TaxID=2182728 RepID=A0A5N5KNU0_9ROSI|nr:hypothetical protein DKX38_018735 [Salix brachista]